MDGWTGGPDPPPLDNHKWLLCFLRNICMGLLRETIGGVQLLLEGDRFILSSVKYVDDKIRLPPPPDGIFLCVLSGLPVLLLGRICILVSLPLGSIG